MFTSLDSDNNHRTDLPFEIQTEHLTSNCAICIPKKRISIILSTAITEQQNVQALWQNALQIMQIDDNPGTAWPAQQYETAHKIRSTETCKGFR